MPTTSDTTTRCHRTRLSVRASAATTATAAVRAASTASRIRRCGTRSASTPPSSVDPSMPTAPAADTTDRSPGPPPRAMTCQTSAIIQTPAANIDIVTDPASSR
jgi:hypothetical protein